MNIRRKNMYKMSFKTWSKKFLNENSPMGDLARDIKQDTNFPSYRCKKHIAEYLCDNHACDAALKVFDKMYEEYKNAIK